MIINVNFSIFCDTFTSMNREDEFSYKAKRELYYYIEENYPDNYELDVIELCCDWHEDKLETVLENYGLDTIEELIENTTVLDLYNGNIVYLVY